MSCIVSEDLSQSMLQMMIAGQARLVKVDLFMHPIASDNESFRSIHATPHNPNLGFRQFFLRTTNCTNGRHNSVEIKPTVRNPSMQRVPEQIVHPVRI